MTHKGQFPNSEAGDWLYVSCVPWSLILLFLPEKSATTTRWEQNVNKGPSLHLLAGPPCDITDDLKLLVLNQRSPNIGVGRAAPQARSITKNKVSHHKGDRLQREPLHFPSPSILPIHPDAQSPHPETSINSSLSSGPMFNLSYSLFCSTSLSIPNPPISTASTLV